MSVNYQLYKSWIDMIKTEASDSLTDWEINFVTSIDNQLETRKTSENPLSVRQIEILKRIYAEKTK